MQHFAVFGGKEQVGSSRLAKNLLAAAEQKETVVDHGAGRRPQSAGIKRHFRPPSRSKPQPNNSSGRDATNQLSREDLIAEVQELKKRLLVSEETISTLKSENHRLDIDAVKQQRRIEQLLHLSEGARGTAQNIRKEIEKSILVRQLKSQVTALRSMLGEKDADLESMRRDNRTSHVKEVEAQCEEYFSEIQRLQRLLDDVKDELYRERQRREWNSKLANETGEELRRELARLAAGYQHILTNINGRSSRPSSAASGARANNSQMKRPLSANATREPTGGPANSRLEDTEPIDNAVDLLEHFNLSSVAVPTVLMSPQSQAVVSNSRTSTSDQEPGLNNYHDAHHKREEPAQPGLSRLRPAVAHIPVSHQLHMVPAMMATIPISVAAPSAFSVGDKVEAKYYNGSSWYKGVVKAMTYHEARKGFVYEVLYEDGEREKNIAEANLRNLTAPNELPAFSSEKLNAVLNMTNSEECNGPATRSSSDADAKPKSEFSEGDRVLGLFDDGNWYAGQVTGVHFDSGAVVYDILYDDGDRAFKLRCDQVRRVSSPIVVAPKSIPTDTTSTHPQDAPLLSTSDVAGDFLATTASAASVKTAATPAPVDGPGPRVGDRVQSQYHDGNWYAAEVTAVYIEADQQRFDVLYDDGARSTGQLSNTVRLFNEGGTAAQVAKFGDGDRVLGLFDDGNWYAGQVTGVHLDSGEAVYDILYDDGDRAFKLRCDQVRVLPLPTPSAVARDSVPIAEESTKVVASFAVGDRVQGQFEDGNWYSGKISFVHATTDGRLYDVLYDDGDVGKRMEERRVRSSTPRVLSTAPAELQIGDRVESYFEAVDKWYPGIIGSRNLNGTFVVDYDDGDREEAVVSDRLRPCVCSPSASTSAPSKFDVGNVIEARFGGGSDWFAGKVRSKLISPTGLWQYGVDYDDGDAESDVAEEKIRLFKHSGAAPAQQKSVVVHQPTSTNLDSFLNDLSDDDDAPAVGGLDGGRAVNLNSFEATSSAQQENDYDDDFAP